MCGRRKRIRPTLVKSNNRRGWISTWSVRHKRRRSIDCYC